MSLRVARRAVHRRHPRRVLGRRRFEQRASHLHRDVERQQRVEQLLGRRLEQIVDGWASRILFELRDRQQPLDDDLLRHDRLELVVDQVHRADVGRQKLLDRRVGNRLRVRPLDVLEQPDFLVAHVEAAAQEEVAALAADQRQRHRAIRIARAAR